MTPSRLLDVAPTFDDIWPCWHAHGWEAAGELSMQDAVRYTRAEARKNYCVDSGEDWTRIGVWKRYIKALTRQERYEWWVEMRCHDEDPPAEVPAGWDSMDEDMPTWQFVARSHPDAIPVWVCGLLSDGTPHKPEVPR